MSDLNNLADMVPRQPTSFFSREWHRYFDKFVPWLQQQGGDKIHPVQDNLGYVYAGDLAGYLYAIGIESKYHWCVMRLNEMESMTDFDETRQYIILPNFGIIDSIMANMETENQNDDDTDKLW